jgi:hypothetical protein
MQDWDKVARAIAGGRPSTEELIKKVERAGFEVRSKLDSRRKVPPPVVDEREALRNILNAVQFAKSQLSKLHSRGELFSLWLGSVEKEALRLLDKQPPPKPKRRGRPARKGPSAATWCAIIVGFLWNYVRDRWPANNIEFRRACAALYAEAGGGETDAESKDGFWRGHWREAESEWRRWEKNSKIGPIFAPLTASTADYYTPIARAVAGLEKNNGENRRALYERARAALLAQLRGLIPALDESDITRERLALEEAIRKVEAAALVRKAPSDPLAELAALIRGRKIPFPPPRPGKPGGFK